MKKYLLFLFLVATALCFGQEVMKIKRHNGAKSEFIERLVMNPTVPDIEVTASNGKKTSLSLLISENRKYKTKPFLLVSTYTFCGGCFSILKSLEEQGITAKYDVYVAVELYENDLKNNRLQDFFKKENIKSVLQKYPFFTIKQKDFGNAFGTNSTPLFMFFDADGKPYYNYISLSLDFAKAHVMETLRLGEKKWASRAMTWYNEQGVPVEPNSPMANLYVSINEQGNRGKFLYGNKKFVFTEQNYLITKDEIIYDGWYVNNNLVLGANGQQELKPNIKVHYKMGVLENAYKTYHQNGKLNQDVPLDGIYKSYNSDGQLIAEGFMKNGLGDGEFKYYKNNVLEYSRIYRNGILYQLTQYDNGRIVLESQIKNNQYYGNYKTYDDKGVLNCKKYIDDTYDVVNCLEDGLSLVKKDEKYGYIDAKGKLVIPLKFDKAESFKNGYAKVEQEGKSFRINQYGTKVND